MDRWIEREVGVIGLFAGIIKFQCLFFLKSEEVRLQDVRKRERRS